MSDAPQKTETLARRQRDLAEQLRALRRRLGSTGRGGGREADPDPRAQARALDALGERIHDLARDQIRLRRDLDELLARLDGEPSADQSIEPLYDRELSVEHPSGARGPRALAERVARALAWRARSILAYLQPAPRPSEIALAPRPGSPARRLPRLLLARPPHPSNLQSAPPDGVLEGPEETVLRAGDLVAEGPPDTPWPPWACELFQLLFASESIDAAELSPAPNGPLLRCRRQLSGKHDKQRLLKVIRHDGGESAALAETGDPAAGRYRSPSGLAPRRHMLHELAELTVSVPLETTPRARLLVRIDDLLDGRAELLAGLLHKIAGQVPGTSPATVSGQVPGTSPATSGQVPGTSPATVSGQVPGTSPATSGQEPGTSLATSGQEPGTCSKPDGSGVIVVFERPADRLDFERRQALAAAFPGLLLLPLGDALAPAVVASALVPVARRHRPTQWLDLGSSPLGEPLRQALLQAVPGLEREDAPRSAEGLWVTDPLDPPVDPEGSRRHWRQRLEIDEDTLLVTMAGDLLPYRRAEDFVRLAHHLRDDSRFAFLLLGRGRTAGVVDDLARFLAPARYHRLDAAPMGETLAASDIVCSTAEHETTALAPLAALAMGCPVVAAAPELRPPLEGAEDGPQRGPVRMRRATAGDIASFAAALEELARELSGAQPISTPPSRE